MMMLSIADRIKRGFPILIWSKGYNTDIAIADLVAGITIGLTLIPQCIAYASLAGLGPQYGLYSSLCGGIIYVAFGSVPELNIAPTALVSLLTFSFTHEVTYGNVHAAILLCFLSGVIELLCGGLHLGFLVDFVSLPVVAAFTSAGALTIASSQIKNLLGLQFTANSFIGVWGNVFTHITEYGLYSSLCGGIIYVAFGSVPELNIAPTALVSLLTFSFTHEVTYGNVHAAILLCFLSGVIELLCGGLHLGFLVDFVSLPVVAAFTSAGALTIASSQIKNLLGLQFTANSFIGVWGNVFTHITEVKKWDALLGISCCVVLLLMRKLKDFGTPPLDGPAPEKPSSSPMKKLIWFCSVGRNAFVVIACAVSAYLLGKNDMTPFSLTSKVPEGLPGFTLPVAEVQNGNATVSTFDMMKEIGAGIVVVPFVAILGNVAIAKAFSKGKVIDASQEMIAVGMCNLIGSFFGSYPTSASFSRAAVSNASGVKTPLAGIYTGVMVILALTFLTPYFPYIPKPTLAAVIICAVVFMVEVTLTKMIWQINKIDLVPFFVTLICCLALDIEIGILAGVCVDLIFLLHGSARPKTFIENTTADNTNYVKVTPTSAILFPSAEYIREKIMQSKETQGDNYKYVVFDCQRINKIDFTAAKCLSAFMSDFKKTGKQMIFYRPKKSVSRVLNKVTDGGARIAETEDDLKNLMKDVNETSISVEISKDNTTTNL